MFKEYTKDQNVDAKQPKRSIIDLNGSESFPIKLDIGCFIEGLLFLNHQEEAEYLNRLFSGLYNNRLLHHCKVKQDKRKAEIVKKEKALFKPKINSTSKQINRSMRSQGHVEDRLLNKQREYEENRKIKAEEKLREEFKE